MVMRSAEYKAALSLFRYSQMLEEHHHDLSLDAGRVRRGFEELDRVAWRGVGVGVAMAVAETGRVAWG